MEQAIRDFSIDIDDDSDVQKITIAPSTSLISSLLAKYVKNSKPVTSLEEEMNRFGSINGGDENIMQFWKTNERDYPKLAKIAKVLLGIPMTSSKSESAFSTAGCLIRKDRASITPYRIERTLFIHDNYDILNI